MKLKAALSTIITLVLFGCGTPLSQESTRGGGDNPEKSQGGSTYGLPYSEQFAYGEGLPAGELPPGDKDGYTSAWQAENAGKKAPNCNDNKCQIKTPMTLEPGA